MASSSSNPAPKALPKESKVYVDWRLHGAINPVREQQRCGCCWAMVACQLVEAYKKILDNNSELRQLSVQNLVDHMKPEIDEPASYDKAKCFASTIWSALEYIKTNGVALEREYPYKGCRSIPRYEPNFHNVKIKDFATIPSKKVSQIIKQLKKQPLGVIIMVTRELKEWRNVSPEKDIYRGGIPLTNKNGDILWHCIVIVGWGYDREKNAYYWIGMNSWGERWGQQGFFKIAMPQSIAKTEKEEDRYLIRGPIYPII